MRFRDKLETAGVTCGLALAMFGTLCAFAVGLSRTMGRALVLLVILLLMRPIPARAQDVAQTISESVLLEGIALPAKSDDQRTLFGLLPKDVRDGVVIHGLIGTSFILHGVDIAQSMYLIGRYPHLFHEANPVLRPYQDNPAAFGAVKMALAAGVNGAIWSIHKERPKLAILMLVANNIGMAYVVHKNAQTGRTVGVR